MVRSRVNSVALLGALLGLLALVELPFFAPDWLLFKANRLVQGESYAPFSLEQGWALTLAGLWGAMFVVGLLPLRARAVLLAALAAAALVVALLFTGAATDGLLVNAAASARVSLQGGVWITVLAYYVAVFAALSDVRRGGFWPRALLVAPGLLIATVLILTGTLSELGLSRELASQGASLRAETFRHLGLAGTSVLFAVATGVPAAIISARRQRVADIILPTVSFLQTLPSLALFGLMLPPLRRLGDVSMLSAFSFVLFGLVLAAGLFLLAGRTGEGWGRGLAALGSVVGAAPLALLIVVAVVVANELLVASLSLDLSQLSLWPGWGGELRDLGVRGIGTAPALIALTLYALLPVVRNTYTGIREVPAAATEAARGMGMSPGQILRRVELPLALPLISEGVRGSAVLTIGIASVAFLIGAGGLGTFIERGVSQTVADLILLGAIPIILLALLADGLLGLLTRALTPRGLKA